MMDGMMGGMNGGMNMIFKSALPSPRGLCCSCTWTTTSDAAGCTDHLLLNSVSPIFIFPYTALLVG